MKQLARRERRSGDPLAISRNKDLTGRYYLSEYWTIEDAGAYSIRLKNTERAFSHGGYAVGDGKVNTRTITVSFFKRGATQDDHDKAVNEAYQHFYQQGYYLIAGRADRCYHVAGIDKIRHKYQKGFLQRWSSVTVTLLLAEPFRYAAQPTTIVYDFKESKTGAEMVINNPSSVDAPLIFTFTPQGNNTAADIQITHEQTGEAFALTDTLLTAPAIAVVDGERGTVRRDTGNSLNTFRGVFLRALPGRNTYVYKGDACRVDVAYTGRWFM